MTGLLFNASAPVSWGDAVHLHVARRAPDGAVSIVDPLVFRDHPPGRVLGEPTLLMTNAEAQTLMDALWNAHVRPTSGQGSAGQLAAVQAHLQDMRLLALGSSAGVKP